MVEAYKRSRDYFWFVVAGFVVAGPVFAAWANMDLSKDSAHWIFERFFLLPHVVAAPLTGLGVVLVSRMALATGGPLRRRLINGAFLLSVTIALAGPAAAAHGRIDESTNRIGGQYAHDVLDSVEPETLILASGDEHTLPLAYALAVERRRPDVILVMAPLLKAAWYVRHLRMLYPALGVPDRTVASTINLKLLVDANRSRPVVMVGPETDSSLWESYGVVRHGLVLRVEPREQSFDFTQLAQENDALLRKYRPPRSDTIRRETFEPNLLRSYAAPAEWIASQYSQFGLRAEAAAWHQRALEIDPFYSEARQGLAQSGGK